MSETGVGRVGGSAAAKRMRLEDADEAGSGYALSLTPPGTPETFLLFASDDEGSHTDAQTDAQTDADSEAEAEAEAPSASAAPTPVPAGPRWTMHALQKTDAQYEAWIQRDDELQWRGEFPESACRRFYMFSHFYVGKANADDTAVLFRLNSYDIYAFDVVTKTLFRLDMKGQEIAHAMFAPRHPDYAWGDGKTIIVFDKTRRDAFEQETGPYGVMWTPGRDWHGPTWNRTGNWCYDHWDLQGTESELQQDREFWCMHESDDMRYVAWLRENMILVDTKSDVQPYIVKSPESRPIREVAIDDEGNVSVWVETEEKHLNGKPVRLQRRVENGRIVEPV